MTDDIDLSEEQQRRMAAKLLGGAQRRTVTVETRRSGKVKPDPVELRFISFIDSYDGEWICCEVQQKASAGWFKIEEYDDLQRARVAAEKYQRSGDKVSWWKREI